jgi:Protein of unknown function (DUF3089)
MRRIALGAVIVGFLIAGVATAGASAKTVWLCKPGQHPDPCTPGLSTTVYSPTLKKLGVEHPKAVAHPAIDCFYVYPTVSGQPTGNSNLQVDPEERSIALYQAARYSQYCRVFAPMYRQETLAGIGQGKPTTTPNPAIALSDVENAFATYLKKDNHGRGFVLIGHSQGSFVLRELIAKDIDPKPAVRRRMISAILMGGNVLVKQGKDIGGDFKHIPACHSNTQLGCVIAFSTFDQPVPTPSLFGRASGGAGGNAPSGDQVLCTNPAALAGGSGLLDPMWPSQPFDPMSILSQGIAALGLKQPTPSTVWFTLPGAYSAQCVDSNGAHVLMIKARDGAQTPNPSPTPEWGLHLLDANIALGNLISIVRSEAGAFVRSGR